ncbi:hypothetical protein OK016_01240 [Vibrio chagasii]|nr:hypothetical protein [Vibrio chagasii]
MRMVRQFQSFSYDGVDYSANQSLLPDAPQTFSFTGGVVTISLNGDFSLRLLVISIIQVAKLSSNSFHS